MLETPESVEPALEPVARLARETPGLRLLVLYGSRARGDTHGGSDWDLGYLADPAFDPEGFRVEVTHHLRTDEVDLVDLERAGGVLRYQVASDARVLFAADPDVFPDFWFRAVSFWCDMQPILQAGHRDVLDRVAEKVGR